MSIHKCLLGLTESSYNTGKSIDNLATMVIVNGKGRSCRQYNPALALLPEEKLFLEPDDNFSSRYSIGKEVQIIFPFPSRYGDTPRKAIVTRVLDLYPLPGAKPLENRKIKQIAHFDMEKINSLTDYLREENSITFVIEDIAYILELLNNYSTFESKFPFHSYMGCSAGAKWERAVNSGIEHPVVLILKLYDIAHVIPIYDQRHVLGIGVHIVLTTPKDLIPSKDRYHPIIEMFSVMSHYAENLLVVDGNTTSEYRTIDRSTMAEIARVCTRSIKTQKVEKK